MSYIITSNKTGTAAIITAALESKSNDYEDVWLDLRTEARRLKRLEGFWEMALHRKRKQSEIRRRQILKRGLYERRTRTKLRSAEMV